MSGEGPVSRLLALAWTVFVACLLLWAAVWIIQQIWGWLLILVVLGTTVLVALRYWRSRRDNW